MLDEKMQKEQEEKKKEFLGRRDKFVKIVEDASKELRISILAIIDYRRDGCIPLIAFIDDKPKQEEKPLEPPKLEQA